ncbi:MAG: NACHT domain-containing NTPase [Microcoleus sp. PH2017_10_PVI_O_A]|uniref:NACHT domain-containing protein n=1 Tax=unclassified Microcoleus TaxID=2642155 RepID=UPI001D67F52D|nr:MULTISPECIES: NACHT domain-containing protein [unclassified Microcoleus]MCC3409667.1 NACHT domain-containing NTPase [Microcoleus sp. PH2017_10_PVI_O_A]MCC3463923.1 NACHT domain-containing NTPase [Microcoleus sp. PH2017_11_PCY_U_A]MCC3481269.1 NACHT domain-containing NTPase [Microcoleus sp. PH2017_12_PCY_D_A]MCC3531297.1 NACHT domain-containing NTPase [Microcoleus sp. PH2017_21_RUC_O_A]MCC3543573.1 NACHT domain-containing NTPase [Microcoleus sp. PH2017_22_RUC_O_B]
MMVRTPNSSEELFAEAGTNWDLQKLYKDLAVAKREFAPHKRRGLTETEKKHLRGLLCGYSPAEMAEKLHKSARGVESDLCSTIYPYVKQLTKRPLNTLKNWRDIPEWLEQTGYKIQVFDAVDGEKAIASSPSEDIEALVQKVRSHFNETIQGECANLCTFNPLINRPMGSSNLSSMYVQTEVNESQDYDSSGFSQERESWEKVVLRNPQLIMLGKPGAGKTTLLQYIALHCDEIEFKPKLVPVFISLKTLVENVKHTEEIDILGYIYKKYCRSNVFKQELESLLSHGRMLFLLDGLDEVLEEKISYVNNLIGDPYTRNRFIISCRKEFKAYQSKNFARFIFVKIADFDRTQRDYFIEKWFDEVVVIAQQRSVKANDLIKKLDRPENQRILELTDTPLLLHLICLIFQERGDLPSKRVDLYREAIDLLLKNWNQFNERLHIDVLELKTVLRRIAAITFETGKSSFEEAEISPIIANFPQTLSNTEVLSGLIIKKGWRQYAFSHQTFQEYLTAEEFVNSKQPLSQLIIHITEPRWREVFLLVAEMLMPADDLLRSIKQSIDSLLKNQIFQDFLQWLDDKSTQVKEVENLRYKLASIRSLYFDLALELDGRNSVYTVDENTLAYAIDPAINDNLDPNINDHLDLNFYDALRFENFYNSISSGAYSFFNIPLDLDLVNHLNHLIHSTINPELQCKLQELKDCILEPEADFDRRQQRWKSHRFIWIKQLRNMMIKYRNIGHDWQFNKEQIKLLKQYYEANKLLWECLAISNVSVEIRSHIENNLFLPLDSSLS